MKKILLVAVVLFFTACGSNKEAIKAIKHESIQGLALVDVNAPVNTNMSPLMYAIRYFASLDIIDNLVKRGADLNWTNKKNQDAFYYAVYYNRLDVLKYLIGKKAKSAASLGELKNIAITKKYQAMLNFLNTLKF